MISRGDVKPVADEPLKRGAGYGTRSPSDKIRSGAQIDANFEIPAVARIQQAAAVHVGEN